MPILFGQIGWDTDAEHFFPGEKSNDGHTMVRCQLFSGRDNTQPHTPARAQGTRMLCHLGDGVFRVPKKNTLCYIAVPDGATGAAGAGCIIATVSVGPEVNRNIASGDLVLSAPGGGQAQIVIKPNGVIQLNTTHNNLPAGEGGKNCILEFGPTGIAWASEVVGSWQHDKNGFRIKDTNSGTRIEMGSMSMFGVPPGVASALSGFFMVTAPQSKLKSANVYLGSGPDYNTAVMAPTSGLQLPPSPVPITTGTTYQSRSVWINKPAS